MKDKQVYAVATTMLGCSPLISFVTAEDEHQAKDLVLQTCDEMEDSDLREDIICGQNPDFNISAEPIPTQYLK